MWGRADACPRDPSALRSQALAAAYTYAETLVDVMLAGLAARAAGTADPTCSGPTLRLTLHSGRTVTVSVPDPAAAMAVIREATPDA